jgi:hypothetical protein
VKRPFIIPMEMELTQKKKIKKQQNGSSIAE